MYPRAVIDQTPWGAAFSGIGSLQIALFIVSSVISSKITQGYDRQLKKGRERIRDDYTRGGRIELHDRPASRELMPVVKRSTSSYFGQLVRFSPSLRVPFGGFLGLCFVLRYLIKS